MSVMSLKRPWNAKKGLKLGLDGEDLWTISSNHLVMAQIYSAMGLEEDCRSSIEKAEETIEENYLFDIRLRLECYKAEIMLQKEIENPISKWLHDIMIQKKENLVVVYPEIYVVEIRYYINENMLDKAKQILDMLQINAEENEDEAFRELNYAIDLSLKEKPIQVYLNEGNLMKELLKKFQRRFKTDNSEEKNVYIDNIINSFKSNLKHSLIRYETYLSNNETLEFIGIEVQNVTSIPVGMIAWVLNNDRLSILTQQNRVNKIVSEHEINWRWIAQSNDNGYIRNVGDFYIRNEQNNISEQNDYCIIELQMLITILVWDLKMEIELRFRNMIQPGKNNINSLLIGF